MNFATFIAIVLVAIIVDFFWLDIENKRWNWLKNRSVSQQVLFFAFFLGASMILYYVFGYKFLN
ncbi:hypothetical protein ACP2W0_17420 [Pseudobacillus badius]|uniref:hypothetical protein n=1 Tax=Bacillus badius TaxID=1455 RepID=UPI0007B04104|nr:hypothetical protein [Bacillus badius]KZN99086.1 hypothetical protein A4244_08310 [Bacillus badius]MED0665032.1 hypothetical protein [Bacillus badius]OCS84024.1 hypothetical protein A6M11_08325 [Bacillus badius]OVE52681.1 hypothetical protein B1A98_03520 [Bacillus badius]TDW04696.1 hypothetical protein B0G66_102123 [Bacillus badius]